MLTPAERVAVFQVISTGQQSLLLGSHGNAIAGSFNIGAGFSKIASSLVVPRNVTAIDKAVALNLRGDLTNFGTIYAMTSKGSTSSITAANMFNRSSGLLSTAIPTGGIAGITNPNSSQNLNLLVLNDLSNRGVISSSGNLSINAGKTIANISTAGTAVISAAQNINLSSRSGSITNSGTIVSSAGNINIASSNYLQDIQVNNIGGTLQALAGSINLRDATYTGAGNIFLNGGTYLSQSLNLYSGSGAISGNVGEISGTVNSQFGSEHISSNSSNFILGNNAGLDPTFANTGNIIISGANSFDGAISIIAGGDITSVGTGTIATTGTNEPITLIAGAMIDLGANPAVPAGSPGTLTGSPTNGVAGTVTVTFTNAHGGNIDFTSSTGGTILSTEGSNVTLLANSNSTGTGNAWFPKAGTSISTGSSTGANVQIIVGGSGTSAHPSAIKIESINSQGSILALTGTPSVTSAGGAIFQADGTTSATFGALPGSIGAISLGAGSSSPGSTSPGSTSPGITIPGAIAIISGTTSPGSITIGGGTTSAGSVTIGAGALPPGTTSAGAGSITAGGTGVGTFNGGFINIGVTSSGSINIELTSPESLNGGIVISNNNGGKINITGGSGINVGAPPTTVTSTSESSSSGIVAVAAPRIITPVETFSNSNSGSASANTPKLVTTAPVTALGDTTSSAVLLSPIAPEQLVSSLVPTDLTRSRGMNRALFELEQSDLQTLLIGKTSAKIQAISIFAGSNFDAATQSKMSNDGVLIGTNSKDKHLSFEQGAILFAPKSDIVVTTKAGDITIRSGAIVLIAQDQTDVAIMDMSDKAQGSVKLQSNGTTLQMVPGEQAIITASNSFNDIALASSIAQRNVEKRQLSNGKHAYFSEFSILSALTSYQLNKRLVSNSADRAILEKLLWSAACIQTVTGGHGAYSSRQDKLPNKPADGDNHS